MADALDRKMLITRASELFGETWGGTKLGEMRDEQLESLISETEMSLEFWGQYDKELADMAKRRR
jgi:hypothetical protein